MYPNAFKKLWTDTNGRIPHLDSEAFRTICEISSELEDDNDLKFWGVVSEGLRYRGHSILRCFNFGNLRVDFPWRARLVNFGWDLPVNIERSGTLRHTSPRRRMLDELINPYLVFCYGTDGQISELLEPGMVITAAGQTNLQRRHYDIVLPQGVEPPVGGGILYYFLSRRLPFQVEPLDNWIPAGSPGGVRRFRMTLQHPVCMNAGWPVLLLEKDRWMWGVVSS